MSQSPCGVGNIAAHPVHSCPVPLLHTRHFPRVFGGALYHCRGDTEEWLEKHNYHQVGVTWELCLRRFSCERNIESISWLTESALRFTFEFRFSGENDVGQANELSTSGEVCWAELSWSHLREIVKRMLLDPPEIDLDKDVVIRMENTPTPRGFEILQNLNRFFTTREEEVELGKLNFSFQVFQQV